MLYATWQKKWRWQRTGSQLAIDLCCSVGWWHSQGEVIKIEIVKLTESKHLTLGEFELALLWLDKVKRESNITFSSCIWWGNTLSNQLFEHYTTTRTNNSSHHCWAQQVLLDSELEFTANAGSYLLFHVYGGYFLVLVVYFNALWVRGGFSSSKYKRKSLSN